MGTFSTLNTRRDPFGPELLGQREGPDQVQQLGVGVGLDPDVGALGPDVVEGAMVPHLVGAGAHVHYPGARLLGEEGQEGLCEGGRAGKAQGQGGLVTVGGLVPGREHPADVVDEDVQACQAVTQLPGKVLVGANGGVIGREERHLVVAGGGADLGGGLGALVRVAAGDDHAGAHGGQAERDVQADAAGPAGDERGLSGHGAGRVGVGCGVGHVQLLAGDNLRCRPMAARTRSPSRVAAVSPA
jgi:hypothetical protein